MRRGRRGSERRGFNSTETGKQVARRSGNSSPTSRGDAETVATTTLCADFPRQSNAVSETNLAALFGLDAEVVRRFHKAKNALKQI